MAKSVPNTAAKDKKGLEYRKKEIIIITYSIN
jgi:hypothetical protein